MFVLLSARGSWHVCEYNMRTVDLKRYRYIINKTPQGTRHEKRGLIYCKYQLKSNQSQEERTDPLSVLICANSRISSSRRPNSWFIRIYTQQQLLENVVRRKTHLIDIFDVFFVYIHFFLFTIHINATCHRDRIQPLL